MKTLCRFITFLASLGTPGEWCQSLLATLLLGVAVYLFLIFNP